MAGNHSRTKPTNGSRPSSTVATCAPEPAFPRTRQGVHRVRYQHQWFRLPRKLHEATTPDKHGLYSAHAIAALLEVKSSTVLAWVRAGVITPTEQGSPGRPYRFQLDDTVVERLKAEKQALDQRRAVASGAARRGARGWTHRSAVLGGRRPASWHVLLLRHRLERGRYVLRRGAYVQGDGRRRRPRRWLCTRIRIRRRRLWVSHGRATEWLARRASGPRAARIAAPISESCARLTTRGAASAAGGRHLRHGAATVDESTNAVMSGRCTWARLMVARRRGSIDLSGRREESHARRVLVRSPAARGQCPASPCS
jgi:hypothetical protein